MFFAYGLRRKIENTISCDYLGDYLFHYVKDWYSYAVLLFHTVI